MKYDVLAKILRSALDINADDASHPDNDLIEKAMKQKFSRRNRSLDSGVIEQRTFLTIHVFCVNNCY